MVGQIELDEDERGSWSGSNMAYDEIIITM